MMAKFDGKFESHNQEWETPQWLFDKLDAEFNFDWDVAADEHNTKCEKFMYKYLDALTQRWDDIQGVIDRLGIITKNNGFEENEKAHIAIATCALIDLLGGVS